MQFLDVTGLEVLWNKIKDAIAIKQDKLVSGTNIKTINSQSILGAGDLAIPVHIDTSNGVVGGPITSEGTISLDTTIYGAISLDSVSNLPSNYRCIHITQEDDPGILSFSNKPTAGSVIEIYVYNPYNVDILHTISITLPNGSGYKCVGSSTVDIMDGEYAKITASTIGSTTYIDSRTYYCAATTEIKNTPQNIDDVILSYNGMYLGLTSSYSTTSTTDLAVAMDDPSYHFNLIFSRVREAFNMFYVQNRAYSNYYLSTAPGWSTTRAELYFSAENHIQTGNQTDGNNRIYLSNATTLAKSDKQHPAAAWKIMVVEKKEK